MKLRVILIASMMAIKGFASAEVEGVNARGRELFLAPRPSQELFYMLWSPSSNRAMAICTWLASRVAGK
jgi:hypothetical protein